jgi:lipopolysaccharide export system protein LptA
MICRAGAILAAAGVAAALVTGAASGADLYAKRMEIVRTPDGQATVFRDSVVITDKDTRITAGLARMYEAKQLAAISDRVFIQSPDAQVWADSALYHLSDRRAELFGDVRVHLESLDITAPRLLYSAADRNVTADSGVALENVARSFRLTGRRGVYDLATDVGTVDSAPVLSWSRKRDSARVTSRRMFWYEQRSRAVAEGDVRLKSGASELACDTAVFYSGSDSGIAWGKPQMHDSSSRASGDSMVFKVRNGALDQVGVRGNAVGQYRTQGGDLIDVSARTIRLWLAGGDVEHIEVSRLISGQLTRAARPADAGGQSTDDKH